MTEPALAHVARHEVTAFNAATASDNKIHDNEVAKQYGFAGGLVPGVAVYGYMVRPAFDLLGDAWLARGTMSARFLKPFYEGEQVYALATVVADDDEGIRLDLEARNERGELCATGTATLPTKAPERPILRDFPEAPKPTIRPFATESVMAGLDILGTLRQEAGSIAKGMGQFLDEVKDGLPAWREPLRVHPGYLIRYANTILVDAVELGPWIHVESETQHLSALAQGEAFSVRGRVVDHFERKGHRFVVLDLLYVAGDARPLWRVKHTAIYEVRKVAAS